MLLLPDQTKYNLEASAAYIADQKAQGSAQRVDLEKTQMAVEGLAKLKDRTRQMTTKQSNIDNGWTDDNKQQCGRDKVHWVEHVYAHFQKNRGKFQSEFPWWQLGDFRSSAIDLANKATLKELCLRLFALQRARQVAKEVAAKLARRNRQQVEQHEQPHAQSLPRPVLGDTHRERISEASNDDAPQRRQDAARQKQKAGSKHKRHNAVRQSLRLQKKAAAAAKDQGTADLSATFAAKGKQLRHTRQMRNRGNFPREMRPVVTCAIEYPDEEMERKVVLQKETTDDPELAMQKPEQMAQGVHFQVHGTSDVFLF
ncbi:hypothetical protein WJX77_003383 [Trebouxia sp. C0004]